METFEGLSGTHNTAAFRLPVPYSIYFWNANLISKTAN